VAQVAVSVANHQQDLPDRVHAVAVLPVQDASRDALTAAWTAVVQEQGEHVVCVLPVFDQVHDCLLIEAIVVNGYLPRQRQ
jgi:hypothetical protein